MAYRTIKLDWVPRSRTAWRTFTTARVEAARLWGDLVTRHHRLRRLNWRWPSKARWQAWAKRKYPNLHSQSVQQIIAEFCEAVEATRQLRKNGQLEACYPWRKMRYRDVIYTNQAVKLRDGYLLLPNGAAGILHVPLPVDLPGRLMEARLCMGHLLLVCAIADVPQPQQIVIGVDLGVNTLLAATDGQKAILVSGRAAKATVQWRNKRLASIQQRQAKHTKGSGRWNRLRRRKAKLLRKAANRVRDLTHKATRKIANAFPGATCYVGKPFNNAAGRLARKQAQQVSSACNARLIAQLDYKSAGAIQVDEAYTSQTCPVCGSRAKGRRVYQCRGCGCTAARDVIGSTNIRSVGLFGRLQTGCAVPNSVQFVYPCTYPGGNPGSSGGHPAGSSCEREAHLL
ncbi:MAG: RNA-guided endonuclease InsQ/TnpB family protein [Roseiflexaceae bacterium]